MMTLFVRTVLLISSMTRLTKASFRPLDFDDSDYYLSVGPQAPPKALIENIRRGHEGLLVKLQELSRALKEDEVKMNNVFYQLGQHNNDLKSITGSIHRIIDSSRTTDAKLNRYSFNIDFLRRHYEKLSKEFESNKKSTNQVDSLQDVVNRLEVRLAGALSRVAMLEKSSNSKYATQNDVYYSAQAPTLITRPITNKGECPTGWDEVGSGCYWVSAEEATYSTALVACAKLGAHLSGLLRKEELNGLRRYLIKDKQYWTSATNAYSASSQWTFLMTGQALPKSSWESSTGPYNYRTLHCAVLGKNGLNPARCSRKYKYICEAVISDVK